MIFKVSLYNGDTFKIKFVAFEASFVEKIDFEGELHLKCGQKQSYTTLKRHLFLHMHPPACLFFYDVQGHYYDVIFASCDVKKKYKKTLYFIREDMTLLRLSLVHTKIGCTIRT